MTPLTGKESPQVTAELEKQFYMFGFPKRQCGLIQKQKPGESLSNPQNKICKWCIQKPFCSKSSRTKQQYYQS